MATYTVRSVLRWTGRGGRDQAFAYEERLTMWNANSLDEAIELAEQEVLAYVESEDGQREGIEPLGFFQAYSMYQELELELKEQEQGVEVFSLIRDSDLEPDDYLDAFFDTGFEHQQGKSPKPGELL